MCQIESVYYFLRLASRISPMSAIRTEPKTQTVGGIRAVPAVTKQSNKKWLLMVVSDHGSILAAPAYHYQHGQSTSK